MPDLIANLETLIEQWRRAADSFGSNPFSDGPCLRVCADQLSALLSAGAAPSLQENKDEETKDLARGPDHGCAPKPGTTAESANGLVPTRREQELEWVLEQAEVLVRDGYGKDAAYCFTEAWGALPPELLTRPPDTPQPPTSWTCGCGWTNGIGLERCMNCTRKPGYDWERQEDNPCTQQ